jgi:hypothetical protein
VLEKVCFLERVGKYTYSLYKCECGKEKRIRDDAVVGGQSSCGCHRGAHLYKHGKSYRPEAFMIDRSKSRAKKKGFEHNIDIDDVVIPEYCPLLGIKLHKGDGKCCANSPTLDRIDNSKGYVKGNVWVISYRANTIKSDATIEELRQIATRLADLTSTGFQGIPNSNLGSTEAP